MKRDKFIPIFLVSLILFTTSFILGYQLMKSEIEPNVDLADQDGSNKSNEEFSDLEILKEENRITPNTIIEERIHYTVCNHIVNKTRKVEDKLVNMTKKDFEEYVENNSTNQRIISFSANRISLGVSKDHLCENHYIIGEEDGKIAIFKIDDKGQRVLNNVFDDYPISLLMEVDQDRIKKGIVVDSEDELSNVLENFIS